jgi:hypothetical protein
MDTYNENDSGIATDPFEEGRIMILPEGRELEGVELCEASDSELNEWSILLLHKSQLKVGDFVMRGSVVKRVVSLDV